MKKMSAILAACTILTVAAIASADDYAYGYAVMDYSCHPQYGADRNVRVATTVFQYCPYSGRWGAGFNGSQFAQNEAWGNAMNVAQQSCPLGSVTLSNSYWQGAYSDANTANNIRNGSWCQNGCNTDYVSIYVSNECHP